ncbi:MAG: hypothetical protein KAS72_03840 [Phycisphaerales bacterium]|nr:hypothetical protein [Phycisphaerales bacterium]
MNADRSTNWTIVIAAVLLSAAIASGQTTYHVYPGQSIQAVINICVDGDEIIVHPGRYEELITFIGKSITLRGLDPNDWAVVEATILDGDGHGPIIACNSYEGSDPVLSGLTITNGDALHHSGGDLDGDGDTDQSDLGILLADYGCTP